MRYLPQTAEDVRTMLDDIGVESVEQLFSSIPEGVRVQGDLDLPPPLDEASLLEHLEELGAETGGRPFLGAGCYPHHVPQLVGQMLLRSELLTAYTPYQPECSQGTLQFIFEFQTMVSGLTGCEVANASMYDGAHAAAEAAQMALRIRRKARRVLVSHALHPDYLATIRTQLSRSGAEVETIPFNETGAMDLSELERMIDGNVACVITGYPNFFGIVEPIDKISKIAKPHKALTVSVTTEAVSLGMLEAPGRLGADLAVGEMGSFGNAMSFGGPSLGFFSARQSHMRQMPGRLCGATVDSEGRRGFALTLSTREQHIRREKATSNICTNQGLCATAAAIHLSLLGRRGIKELARLNWLRARHLRRLLAERGLETSFSGPVFNEFALAVRNPAKALRDIEAAGLEGGLDLSRFYDVAPASKSILLCVTEVHSPKEIERLADALGGRE